MASKGEKSLSEMQQGEGNGLKEGQRLIIWRRHWIYLGRCLPSFALGLQRVLVSAQIFALAYTQTSSAGRLQISLGL